ncbi:conjugal transfer protein TraG [Pasteurella multocida]|uniref:type IV secretory system conjugative DNA transfer family protein n=1 Tax=Pasteurella multocida TaxID=747 RepID=UPI000CE8ECAB|nr:type IV secretory system conjugative DNA transfer family protein [Pasteurella multocida]PPE94931.1 conjugal transfer protein TraG [Pasteurella multocida]PPE95024.1 conjugal transfer protein TraG [Pasteurella multocida]HDR1236507.1 type IV secretory system conjugative DNA transfer family protein [Pasteurella multocida]HDR1500990.1 type IV secretory system conjugative DNA transfer family protein [Pasteurella multocida]
MNKTQKNALILISPFLFFGVYSLSVCVLVIMLSDLSGGNFLSKINKIIFFIENRFSLTLPFKAISQGFILKPILAFVITTIFLIFVGVALHFGAKQAKKQREIFGKAEWSGEAEIRKNCLREEKGIIVGKDNKGNLLRFGGQEFASVGAPTRSGKGVGIVIPNLLTWENSLVVLDVKQECFSITSKYRAFPVEKGGLGQKVFLFDPFSFNTHRYNPLEYLDFNSPDIELQIQGLANSLYPTGKGGKEFFILQAQSIFVSCVYLMGKLNQIGLLGSTFTLTSLAGILQGVKVQTWESEKGIFVTNTYPLQETVETVKEMGLLTETIYAKFLSFFDQAEAKDQFTGIKASFETPLKVFQDPLFEMATSTNDFDFRDLRKEKITIYIGITPENISTARPILNLLFSQLIYENIRQGLPDTNPDLKHSILMLMDEFTSIGFMEQYQVAIGYMAGYNIRSLIIYQNQTQLAENQPLGYGDKGSQTLLENHSCNIIYRPKNPKVAEEISKRIGNITIINKNKSHGKGGTSTSDNTTQRALVLPQEIMDLKDDEEIIFCNSAKIKCKKAFFYNDPFFINRLKLVSLSLRELGDKLPTKEQLEKAYQNKECQIELPNQYEFYQTQQKEREKSEAGEMETHDLL